MNYLEQIRDFIYNKWVVRKIIANDCGEVATLKRDFEHYNRVFVYKRRRYNVDCLYCHATPGLIETVVSELSRNLKKNNKKNKLLNLGGGTGQVAKVLKEIGFDVYNVDIEIKKNDERNFFYDLNSDEKMPFPDEFFDYVLCQEVIEHIENPWRLLRVINSLSKSDGIVLLTTPNIQSIYSKNLFNKTNNFHWFGPQCTGYHINPMPDWEIRLIAEKTGLKIKKLFGSGDYYLCTEGDGSITDTIANNESLIYLMEKTLVF